MPDTTGLCSNAAPSCTARSLFAGVQAGQDARKNIAAPFVLVLSDGTVAGYYTLSATAINLAELPEPTARKLRRYRPSCACNPASAGYAVDEYRSGQGIWPRAMLADALFRAFRSEIASFAVIVDAEDESARRFYQRESFLSLPEQPMKLFLPMADMAQLFPVRPATAPSGKPTR